GGNGLLLGDDMDRVVDLRGCVLLRARRLDEVLGAGAEQHQRERGPHGLAAGSLGAGSPGFVEVRMDDAAPRMPEPFEACSSVALPATAQPRATRAHAPLAKMRVASSVPTRS